MSALFLSVTLHVGGGVLWHFNGLDGPIPIGESQVETTTLRIRSIPVPKQEKVVEPQEPDVEELPQPPQKVVEKVVPKKQVTKSKKPKVTKKETEIEPHQQKPTAGDREAQRAMAASFESKLLAWLARHKQYPLMARRRGIEGTSVLSIVVSADGSLVSAELSSSSGSSVLDDETLSMARRAEPFPSFPAELRKSQLSLRVPVTFELRG